MTGSRPSLHVDTALLQEAAAETGPSLHVDTALLQEAAAATGPSLHVDTALLQEAAAETAPSLHVDTALLQEAAAETGPSLQRYLFLLFSLLSVLFSCTCLAARSFSWLQLGLTPCLPQCHADHCALLWLLVCHSGLTSSDSSTSAVSFSEIAPGDADATPPYATPPYAHTVPATHEALSHDQACAASKKRLLLTVLDMCKDTTTSPQETANKSPGQSLCRVFVAFGVGRVHATYTF